MKTWKLEMAVVGIVLGTVVAATGGGWLEVIGGWAVLLSFAHAQVADRLAEREAARVRPSVACHAWATRYLLGKESLWLVYFVLHRSWSALAGVGLFLAYPAWRRFWRARKPLVPEKVHVSPFAAMVDRVLPVDAAADRAGRAIREAIERNHTRRKP